MIKTIGIDIGASNIKAVAVDEAKLNSGGGVIVSVMPLPKDAIVDGNILNYADISGQVEKVIELGGFPKTPVSLSIKGAHSFVKRVKIPFVNKGSIKDDIRYVASQYLNIEIERYSVDYIVLSADDDNHTVDVILGATEKERISDFVSIIESADQKIGLIDLEPLALSSLYNFMNLPKDGVSLILEFGHDILQMIYIKGGVFSYYMASVCSGAYCSNLLVNIGKIDPDMVEDVKQNPDNYPDGEIVKQLIKQNYLSDVIRDVYNSIALYKLTGSDEPKRIYLSGGGAGLYGLRESLEERFKCNVGVMNPNISSDNPNVATVLNNSPAIFNVAFAMALRGTNR